MNSEVTILNFKVLLAFLIYSNVCFCQKTKINFETFTDADGLSSNSIQSITQDNKGFMWFATENGLNKYDGYTFKSFNKNDNDSQTISNNRIEQVFADSFENLYLKSGDGSLNIFDLTTEKTNRYTDSLPNGIPNKNIAYILPASNNILWLGTNDKVIYKIFIEGKGITPETKYFKYKVPQELQDESSRLFSMYHDDKGTLWISDVSWIYIKMIPDERVLNKYRFEKFDSRFLNQNNRYPFHIGSIAQDKKKNYWISTYYEVIQFNAQGKLLNTWSPEGEVRGNFVEQNNFMWFSTNKGIARINTLNNEPEYFNYEADNKNSVAFIFINGIYIDKQQIVWAGTPNGLSRFDSKVKKFALFNRKNGSQKNDLLDNRIRAIAANEKGIVWLGTDQHGLSRYDVNTGVYKNFVHTGKSKNEIADNSYGSLYCINDSVWSAVRLSEVQVIDDFNGNISKCKTDNKEAYIVKSIAKDLNGFLWLGGNNSLCRLNRFTNKISIIDLKTLGIPLPYSVRALSIDSLNTLWIGLESGGILCNIKLDKKSEPISLKKYILPGNLIGTYNGNTINTICVRGNNIWMGTYGGGLKTFNTIKSEFKVWGKNNGLPDEIVYGIMDDNKGNLWMSTNKGISKFIISTETFFNYSSADGLQGNEYNSGAYCKNSTGHMFFGGTNGWNMFHPDSIKQNTFEPEVVFTDFQIFNKPVQVNESSVLKKNLNYADELVLQSTQSVFSFEFAALNFTNSVKNNYQYKLDGYDTDWQHTGTRRFITFTNLNPGNYTLKIKGSNNDGVWSTKIKTLRIVILPAWYQTWWFKALIALAVFLLIATAAFFVVRFRRIKKEEQRKIRDQIKKDLHDDLKSDLAAIQSKAGLVAKVLQRGDNERAIARSNEISELTQRALSTVDDLSWAFNPAEDSTTELFKRMKNFIVAIMPEEINYSLETPQHDVDIVLPFKTRKHFYLIFKECLYNMVKHSKCKNAFIHWEIQNEKLFLTIKDDGVGFDLKNLSRKNGLTHIQERATEINGKLTIESQPNRGTIITLEIATT